MSPNPNRKETILEKAERVVMGNREEAYGHPKMNHMCTATMWNAYLDRRGDALGLKQGVILRAEDVCFLNILQKVSRCANKITKDNLADIAGWAYCVERIFDADDTSDLDIDNMHEFSSLAAGSKICERCHRTPEHRLHFKVHEFRPDAKNMKQCVYCGLYREAYLHDVGSSE